MASRPLSDSFAGHKMVAVRSFFLAAILFRFANAQQCTDLTINPPNCHYGDAPIIKCGQKECYKFGNIWRPIVGQAKAGDYCWEYCWGKVDKDCKRDFYSNVFGAWRCPQGQVCRYLKRGAYKCFNAAITLKKGDLCWDMNWPKEKKLAMRNEYCPYNTVCSMTGVWNSNRRQFYCSPLPAQPACFALPGSNYVHNDYWPQTYETRGGMPCGGVYRPCYNCPEGAAVSG